MSKAEFTKGEWYIDDAWVACDGSPVCAMGDSWVSYDNSKENAHLIAAAPEMYEILKMLLDKDAINNFGLDIEVAKLLKKARGK